jgi:signal transduction histidine kinase
VRRFQSIRFRLSLGLALAVFAIGSFLVGGIYLWQVRQLNEPVLTTRPLVIEDKATGQVFETDVELVFREEIQRAAVEKLEQDAYRVALNQLRRASFAGLGVLFVASFGSGWWLSGWALKPVDRMNSVARDISANDLSRRISLRGPADELKGLADTFDDMLDRLEDSFDEQRRFVHEASHELRNPLAVARTNLELALLDEEPAEVRRAAQIAHRATERMTLLVEDLLEQARRGIPELARTDVDLSQMVADKVVEFRAAASERHLSLVADLGGGEVATIGDGPALNRAVANLMANAVRLAPEGSTIRVSTAWTSDGVSLSVSDEGPGIDSAHLDAVFDRFWRGQDPGAGSGLGLSIVRRIAERHGGTATVTSEPGRGSVFTISLPRSLRE